MLIEKFITYIARKKNASYLRFSPSAALSVPPKVNDSPTLLYVHIPFCEELCPYCSFNRVVFREDLARLYFEALRKEILMYRDLGYDFQGLYVGGGTPTVLIDELALTLQLIRETYHVTEISVETNPNHLTDRNLRTLKEVGVNRLSVGVQTFDDNLLKIVERYHKYGSGQEISERLRSTQGIFDTLNVDMIFNFPTQTLEILEKDLATLIALKADQITYYPLMVSSSTQDVMSRKMGIVDYNRGGSYYAKIVEMLSREYRTTTAWCFSRTESPIDEYVVNYDEYAGLGSGSIGYLGGSAYSNTFDIRDYISRVNQGTLPITAKRDFSLQERFRYDFLMKLFGLELDLKYLSAKHGVGAYGHLWPEITFFRLVGGLRKKGKVLRLTETGQYYWVLMMREFFIGVNNFRDYCRAELPREA
ncbi:MAG: Oxygen-independent coproporphyrinogen-III oxidase 1 [Syntrophorhabdus sp. PtaU1.Bin002]|nr:MAG: Oxygen-independent coproporphyrinogen-III oxidase 1 [Syntrophorhabdus sp. PtaB.Bin006]OPY67505.1 MAG: Oxygen-independent coproporphyrinogen-III oxidase 1 [Syntrophorhabdus sp. PtaU1.Bin002]